MDPSLFQQGELKTLNENSLIDFELKKRIWLSCVGVISVILSLISGFGIASAAGFVISNITFLIPFILLGEFFLFFHI